jgi:hypothetical protein
VAVCGGLWWFVVICGGLWWFVVVCGACHDGGYGHVLNMVAMVMWAFHVRILDT